MKAERLSNWVTEPARAKLNLFLDVLGKRPDGYHEMLMVMQTVALCDDVSVSLRPDRSIRCDGGADVPSDERNLAWKAAARFLEHIGQPEQGFAIEIRKRIPSQAGMAGGSADAAAVLRALNRAVGEPLSREELCELGAQVGSDVPYCVLGGTRLARGRGELLSDLPQIQNVPVVICKPVFSGSTPALFGEIDRHPNRPRYDLPAMLEALDSGEVGQIGGRMANAFHPLVAGRHPEVTEICAVMRGFGACGAMLTGTGSAVFGLFERQEQAEQAAQALSGQYEEVFLTTTV